MPYSPLSAPCQPNFCVRARVVECARAARPCVCASASSFTDFTLISTCIPICQAPSLSVKLQVHAHTHGRAARAHLVTLALIQNVGWHVKSLSLSYRMLVDMEWIGNTLCKGIRFAGNGYRLRAPLSCLSTCTWLVAQLSALCFESPRRHAPNIVVTHLGLSQSGKARRTWRRDGAEEWRGHGAESTWRRDGAEEWRIWTRRREGAPSLHLTRLSLPTCEAGRL